MNSIFYIIATPIGNLEDITYRAIRIISEVDVILCEDTRVTQKLLNHYNIKVKTQSYHAQASNAKEDSIINDIKNGVTFALVSDAGTPTISDPGVKLISRIRTECPETQIVSLPGASALITGLSTTGFSGNQFTFYGFLPHKKGRTTIFSEIFESDKISLFYESPHRIMKTLEYIHDHYLESGRKICIARELTKMYEQKIIGDISTVYTYFLEHPEKIKGEFVVVIDKA